MPTSTEEIDIAKLLINGRQGRAFRDFDRDMKEWLKAEYMHMSKYFYTGTPVGSDPKDARHSVKQSSKHCPLHHQRLSLLPPVQRETHRQCD